MTRWRLRAIDGWPGPFDVMVTVDTDDAAVTDAIELAAEQNGIYLVRLDGEERRGLSEKEFG
jgi:hypothetical protein